MKLLEKFPFVYLFYCHVQAKSIEGERTKGMEGCTAKTLIERTCFCGSKNILYYLVDSSEQLPLVDSHVVRDILGAQGLQDVRCTFIWPVLLLQGCLEFKDDLAFVLLFSLTILTTRGVAGRTGVIVYLQVEFEVDAREASIREE